MSILDIPIKSVPLPQTDCVISEQSDERFVDIYTYSDKTVKVSMQYAISGIDGAITTAYVRKSVADRLLQAKKLLPSGYTFEILDAWRPYDVQLALYNAYKRKILKDLTGTLSEDEIKKRVCEFVSYPDKSKKVSFVHSCGGAVDLTIVDGDGNRLDMGSDFDEFTKRSYTDYYEKVGMDERVRKNRRLLYHTMCSNGFTNYPAEWWHYDFGDSFWSFYTGKNAIYTSRFEVEEVIG